MNFSILKIGSLNINGNLLDKSSNKDFCELVQKYDIFCIQESWLTETQNLNVENYKLFRSDRVKKKKAIRGSGGVVILFKKHLEKGLSKIISKSTDILWMKFDKTFFNLEKIYTLETVIFLHVIQNIQNYVIIMGSLLKNLF